MNYSVFAWPQNFSPLLQTTMSSGNICAGIYQMPLTHFLCCKVHVIPTQPPIWARWVDHYHPGVKACSCRLVRNCLLWWQTSPQQQIFLFVQHCWSWVFWCAFWEDMGDEQPPWLTGQWWIMCMTQDITHAFSSSNLRCASTEQPSGQSTGKSHSSERCMLMCRNNGDF